MIMDGYIKRFYEFNEALSIELFKEMLIKGGRLLTAEERQEVIDRTVYLRSKGEYKPDPDLERYWKRKWLDGVDSNDPKALIEGLKKSQLERERLRKKFLKERELAESKDSSPDEPKTKVSGNPTKI